VESTVRFAVELGYELTMVKDATSVARAGMKLEVIVIPVSGVGRAKAFYGKLGWRLDADFAACDDFRVSLRRTLPLLPS
jgi:hypothetical protein